MKHFDSIEQARKYMRLGKFESEIIEIGYNNVILCGTNILYDDRLWDCAKDIMADLKLEDVPEFSIPELRDRFRDTLDKYLEEYGYSVADLCEEY